MAALTANRPVPNTLQPRNDCGAGVVVDMVMTASQTIYEGSFVGFVGATGTVRALVAGDVFAGIATKKVVSAATGVFTVPVLIGGFFQHALATVASASVGVVVYASDDNTLALTGTSTVGRIVSVPVTGTCVVKMKTVGEASAVTAGAVVNTAQAI